MNISPSKFILFFLAIFYIFCIFLTQKTVSVIYSNRITTYATYERTVKDILLSQQYSVIMNQTNQSVINKPLTEGMVLEVLSNRSIRQVLP